ncbi:MAG: hypothetical protein HY615_11825 [Candidatus Rokubacteria bacterium]|nr:hypothetical protein [Candidatus Rokubacteria bacterium]
MTTDEHGQLIQFLGQKFGEVDRHFTQVDARFAQVDAQLLNIRREIADNRSDFEAFRVEVRQEFEGVRDLIRLSHAGLDRRVRGLEEGR